MMTPQERDVLLPLLDKLRQTRLPEKDIEADRYIHEAVQEQPDLAYILTQTVLMQDYALHAAQDRIHALESQSQQGQSSGSFLSGLFGGGQAAAQPQAQQGPWGGAGRQPYAQPLAAQSGQPSFLRSAAQTAAGIAGGALLFSGIESLFGMGRGGFGGGGFLGGGGFGSGMVENNSEVVNNYYDQPAPDQSGGGMDSSDYSDASDTGSDFGGDGGGMEI